MKKLFTLSLLLILPFTLLAQRYKILDTKVEIQDSIVVVTFSLLTEEPVDLGLFGLKDSTTWILCKAITGDIERQTTGMKTIIWESHKDGYLHDDIVQSNMLFRLKSVEPYAIQRAIDAKILAKKNRKEERMLAREKDRAEGKIANENLNGHYFGLGSSGLSSGYYGGTIGVSYEYRHGIFGANIAVGYEGTAKNMWGSLALNANVGLKFYLAETKKMARNFYFNILPFCYLGQNEIHNISHYSGDNNNIIQHDEYLYPHIWGAGLFFGYSPIWHINKKVALGFNVNVGIRANYRFNKWCPLNWDAGFVIKL